MERVARKCERRGFADGARLLRSNLYQDPRQKTHEEDSRKIGGTSVYPGDWLKNRRNNLVEPAAAAPAPSPEKAALSPKAAKPPPAPAPAPAPAPPAPEPAAAEPAVGAKPKKPAKRKSPERDPTESEFEKWVKTRPWYPLFREARPWYPNEKPSPAKKPKSEK